MKCIVCGNDLIQYDPNIFVHPNCDPFQVDEEDPEAELIKSELTEIIRWADKNSPRSLQTDLGPSELGSPCDRRLGYRMAGVDSVNRQFDPWAAIVGTAIHSWLEKAIKDWCAAHGNTNWVVEQLIQITDVIRSHPDLFNVARGTVIDHKSAGPDVMKKVRAEGPPIGYQIQTMCYGYAYEKLGYKVNKVALAFYPRSGWLKNMYVWTAKYDRSIAELALNRPPSIAATLLQLDVLSEPHRWEQVPATPSNDCGWCPWYNQNLTREQGASDQGCPGG